MACIIFLPTNTKASKRNSVSEQSAGNRAIVRQQMMTTKTSNMFAGDVQKCYKGDGLGRPCVLGSTICMAITRIPISPIMTPLRASSNSQYSGESHLCQKDYAPRDAVK